MAESKDNLNVMFIGGVFDSANQRFVAKSARQPVEYSSNLFQQKLIEGIKAANGDVQVLSAPFINAFPKGSRVFFFKGFEKSPDGYEYVAFNNVWGYRNISREKALKKKTGSFVRKKGKKLIVVYSAHTPFIAAAVHAKKADPSIKICIVVPDLPEYMNLRSDRSRIYNFAKKIDNRKMHSLMKSADSFVLLTDAMRQRLPVDGKKYIVKEGIVSPKQTDRPLKVREGTEKEKKYVVYTGKTDEAFGVKNLVDAMEYIQDKKVQLIICGRGDSSEYIKQKAEKDPRILFCGPVSPREAADWQKKANLLINPREDRGEYTKYSFPSKNIEYLLTGNPVAGYMLKGMPEEYGRYMYVIPRESNAVAAIAKTIEKALSGQNKKEDYSCYAKEKLLNSVIAKEILEM